MTLDPLRPFLAGAVAGVGGLLVWSVFVCTLPDAQGPAVRPAAKRPSGGALRLDRVSALVVRDLRLPDGPFTAECWANCDDPRGTQSLFGNAKDGGFKILWRDEGARHQAEWPTAWVRSERTLTSARAGWTAVPSAEPPTPGGWTHVAMTCDGTRVRLFVNGRIAGDRALLGAVVPGGASFFVGADAGTERDPATHAAPTDFFRGLLDEVRISRGVRYDESFRPRARLETDAETVLHLTFDDPEAPWRDASAAPHEVRTVGKPEVIRP